VFSFVSSFHPNQPKVAQLSPCISPSCPTMWRRWCLGFCLCRTVLAVPSTACPDVEQGTLQVGGQGGWAVPLWGDLCLDGPGV
jgi:hypothetical protein